VYVHAIDSGTLEAPEIHAELLALQQPLTLAEVVLLMSEVDIRNDGAVDFSQFKVN
jgi:Ca2+-binding EF-hand superfamily protein